MKCGSELEQTVVVHCKAQQYFEIMTTKQIQLLIQLLSDKGVLFDSGLTAEEVYRIETRYDVAFPPDLKALLQKALPMSDGFVNWRLGLESEVENEKVLERLGWPLEGMLFDVQWNGLWIKIWGDKPDSVEDQFQRVREKFKVLPKLIPIYSHRYIPSRPYESGNPVFSVYQMDIIYYGYDLATYLANEFQIELPKEFDLLENPKREIEFWSNWVDEGSRI